MVGPVRAASSSVAWPSSADSGMMASALRPKTARGDQCSHSAAIAKGIAASSQLSQLMVHPAYFHPSAAAAPGAPA